MQSCSTFPRKRLFLAVLIVAALTVALTPLPATAAVINIAKVVISGDLTPDGNGMFRTVLGTNLYLAASARLNNQGKVLFSTDTIVAPGGTFPTPSGLFQATTTPGSLIHLIGINQQVPGGGNETFSSGSDFTQNNTGQVVFRTLVRPPIGQIGVDLDRTYFWDTAGVSEIMRTPLAIPNTNLEFGFSGDILINDSGRVAMLGRSKDTSRSVFFPATIVRFDGTTPTVLAVEGQAISGGGTLTTINDFGFNNAGQAVFTGGFGVSVLRSDNGTLVEIAKLGDPAPTLQGGTLGTLVGVINHPPSLNDPGQVAFISQSVGVFRGDGNQLEAIARVSDLIPPGAVLHPNPIFSPNASFDEVLMNNAGDVVFGARVDINPFETADDFKGIFVGDGNTLTPIARTGDPTPSGVGKIADFRQGNRPFYFTFNQAGQVAFLADIDLENGGSFDDLLGLFVYDGTEVVEILREGDSLFGSTVIEFSFLDGINFIGPDISHSGFNDLGQIAFAFGLADGRGGIAVASLSPIPEPTSLSLLAVVASFLLPRRRRVAS